MPVMPGGILTSQTLLLIVERVHIVEMGNEIRFFNFQVISFLTISYKVLSNIS
jgi:hypothetical protein